MELHGTFAHLTGRVPEFIDHVRGVKGCSLMRTRDSGGALVYLQRNCGTSTNLDAEPGASSAQRLIHFKGALYSLALFEVRADIIAVGSANPMKKRAKGFRLT